MLDTRTRLSYWITEREAIRIRKSMQQSPLTNDPILATMRFCNVNREDDAVTRWVKTNVRDAYANMGIPFQMQQLVASRIFNHPATLEMLLPITDFSTALEQLQAIRQRKMKILRGAYLMPPHRKGAASIEEYWLSVVEDVGRQEYTGLNSLQAYADTLLKIHGLGPFIVNQLCTDLRYMPIGKNTPDWDTFLLCGPGTTRGLNRVLTGSPKARLGKPAKYAEMVLWLRDTLVMEMPELALTFRDPNNVANCLCEFDKYERVRENLLLENPRRVKMRKY